MTPIISPLDVAHCGFTHAVISGDLAMRTTVAANGINNIEGQFRASVRFSVHAALTPLGIAVGVVARCCGQKQMPQIQALGVVASMADKIIRRPVRVDPSSPMRRDGRALPSYHSIGHPFPGRSDPRPACIWTPALVSVMVETLGKRPMTGARESSRGSVSHDSTPIAVAVRAGRRGGTRVRPAFSSTNCDGYRLERARKRRLENA